jgi:replication factor A1
MKAGMVSDFSGKSVGTISSTQFLIDPDLPAAHQLWDWFDGEGRHSVSQSISREGGTGMRTELHKIVSAIKDEGLGRGDKPDWITVRAMVFYIKPDNFCYTACPLDNGGKQCNKKVTNNGGTWRCDRCDRTVPECDYRSVFQFLIIQETLS